MPGLVAYSIVEWGRRICSGPSLFHCVGPVPERDKELSGILYHTVTCNGCMQWCAELGWARIASGGWDGGHDAADLLEQMRVAQREGRAAVQCIVENSTTASGPHSSATDFAARRLETV